MRPIERVLPAGVTLANAPAETPPQFGCLASILVSAVARVFGLAVAYRLDARPTPGVSPNAIVAATCAVVALKFALDPTGRRRPIGVNLALVGVAGVLGCVAVHAVRGGDLSLRGGHELALARNWFVSAFFGWLSLRLGVVLGRARSALAPLLRVVSVVAVALLAVLVASGAARRCVAPDREAYLRALPVLGTIPSTRDESGFWGPVMGEPPNVREGRVGGLRVRLERGAKEFDNKVTIRDADAPEERGATTLSSLLAPRLLASRLRVHAAVLSRDANNGTLVLDDSFGPFVLVERNRSWELVEPYGFNDVPVRGTKLAPPRVWVITGAVGLLVSLALRLSRRHRIPFPRASWRPGHLDAHGRLTLEDGEVFDHVEGPEGPIVALSPREPEPVAYRHGDRARVPALFFGDAARLEEGAVAARAARDSLALAIACLAGAPLVACAFERVLW